MPVIIATLLLLLIAVTLLILIKVIQGLVFYKKYNPTTIFKKYAFFVPARNEENVILNLINSFRELDYPKELVKLFIIANNCTDKTSTLAIDHGVEVVILDDPSITNVGMVLNHFFKHIKKTYGDYNAFDAYIRLDADNVLERDFLKKMNDTYVKTKSIVVAYRATNNLGYSIPSYITGMMMYSMAFAYRLFSHYDLNPIVTGPGVLIPNRIISAQDGWKHLTISEDMEFSSYITSNSVPMYYQYEAIFYDEQPVDFKTTWTQRIRWQKGHFSVFRMYFFKLLKSLFSRRFFSNLFHFIGIFPIAMISTIFSLGFFIFGIVSSILNSNINDLLFYSILPLAITLLLNYLLVIIIYISERKRIKLSLGKKILYLFTFPLTFYISGFADCLHFFYKNKWKHIAHKGIKS